jgi:hypothetical protein
MRIQLIAKGLIRADEWEDLKNKIRYDYQRDNHFTELKDAEILNNRIQSLQLVDPYLGKYFSKKWVQKNVLKLDDEEIDEMKKEIEAEGEEAIPTELSNMQTQMQMQADMEPEPDPNAVDMEQASAEQDMQHKQELHDVKLKKAKAK